MANSLTLCPSVSILCELTSLLLLFVPLPTLISPYLEFRYRLRITNPLHTMYDLLPLQAKVSGLFFPFELRFRRQWRQILSKTHPPPASPAAKSPSKCLPSRRTAAPASATTSISISIVANADASDHTATQFAWGCALVYSLSPQSFSFLESPT